jgi:hypothetical protein
MKTSTTLKLVVGVSYVAMVALNALANIIPINGLNTGQISDSYPNLFAPAGITFSIWGVIYLLLAAFTLYYLGLFRFGTEPNDDALTRIGIYFAASSIANAVWILAWHYLLIPVSMLLMLVILVCLAIIALEIRERDLSSREKLFIALPFGVYFGWITVATIANATTLLVSLGFNGLGLSEQIWTAVVILVGLVIGMTTMLRNRDRAYGAVIVWAYAGIIIKHTAETGFAGQYPAVIAAAAVSILVLLVAGALGVKKPGIGLQRS